MAIGIDRGTANAPATSAPASPEEIWNLRRMDRTRLRAPTTPLTMSPERPWTTLVDRRSDELSSQIQRTLERGRIAPRDPSSLGALDGGINGALDVRTIVDRSAGGHSVRAVLKPVHRGGAQELFAYEVARAMKVDHLVQAVGRRSDGTAAMEFRPGSAWRSMGVKDADSLERAFRHGLELRHPELSAGEIARRARVDRQLVQTLDVVLANGDRHGHNGLFDAKRGVVSLIDHGLIDRRPVSPVDGLPSVRTYGGGVGAKHGANGVTSITVGDEVRQLLATTDRAAITRAFAQLQRDQARSLDGVGAFARAQPPEYLEQVLQRIDDVVRTGKLRFLGFM
jgi:hypothetical protein